VDFKIGEKVYVKRWRKAIPDGDGWEVATIVETLPDLVRVKYESGNKVLVESHHIVRMERSK
jgi:sRNA-binding protein